MQLTPLERRARIYKIAEADAEYSNIMAEFAPAKIRFEKLTDKLPKRFRNLLWGYPGMGHFLHHRMLTLICEHMIFPDEV